MNKLCFLINATACFTNIVALVYNGGSNPTMMFANGACVLLSGGIAFLSLRKL